MRSGGTIALSLALTLGTVLLAAAAAPFLDTFDLGAPTAPLTYSNPNRWDILPSGLDTRQNGTWAQRAHHGPDCGRPGFPYTTTNSHPISSTRDMVFVCNNHIMTATGLAGYAAIYMVPPAMADFSAGAATISFEMSTLRTSSRDWVYFTLMPFDSHNKYAYNNLDQAIPPHNINIHLAGENVLTATQRFGGGVDTRISGDGFTTWDMVQAAHGLSPDAARRDKFRIEISRTHLRVCLTGTSTGVTYTYRGTSPFCWIDSDLPASLSPSIWNDQAVFMMTHVAYNPEKSCSSEDDQFSIVHNPTGDANCPPNTWHWDNMSINPASEFTILNPVQQFAAFSDPSAANTVTFPVPAPANAFLSYIADGDCSQQRFSVNGGLSWITAVPQPTTTQCAHPENGGEYWTPIPAGTTSVRFTGTPSFGRWGAAGIAIWSAGRPTFVLPTPAPTAAPTVAPTVAPTSAPTSAPTTIPTVAPALTGSPLPTSAPTSAPTTPASAPPTSAPTSAPTDPFAFLIGLITPSSPSNPPSSAPSATVAPSPASATSAPASAAAASDTQTQSRTVSAANPPELVVPASFHSSWVSQSSDATLPGGSKTTVTVRFRNTGTASWVKGVPGQQANLAVSGEGTKLSYGWPSADRVAMQMEDVVAPGEIATFEFDVRAPNVGGAYRLDLRPVVDGMTWLEDEGVFFTVNSDGLAARDLLAEIALILESVSSMALGLFVFVLLGVSFLALRVVTRRRPRLASIAGR
jgi:hypothetical protein